jgi:membrane-associated phospholipid phosphatase
MLPFERMAAAFFTALALAALTLHRRPAAWRAGILSAMLVVAIVAASRTAPEALRTWLAHFYLVGGYWIPALLARGATGMQFEHWLMATDLRWRRVPVAFPRWLAQLCELAYLLCYPLVPALFAIVWLRGTPADVNRFWMAVLAAGFASYGSLPWLVSRPPRLVAGEGHRAAGIARVNTVVLSRVSHQLNTFPSGHVAVAIAAALSAWPVMPVASVAASVIAIGVAIGAVTGRYHYVLDVITGAVAGLLSVAITASWGR